MPRFYTEFLFELYGYLQIRLLSNSQKANSQKLLILATIRVKKQSYEYFADPSL